MRRTRLTALILAGLLCVVGHQACQKVAMDDGTVTSRSVGGGNGIGDEGKPQHYYYYDEQTTCTELDSKGKPLANAEIVAGNGVEPTMVRSDCVQLAAPLVLASAEVRIADGRLLYRGLSFVAEGANQLTETETFAAPAWVQINASVDASAVTAPNGTPTAHKLVESAGLQYHYLAQQPAYDYTPGTSMTFSVYVKAGERAHVRIQIQDGTAFNDQIRADFSLAGAGSLMATGVNAQGSQVSGAITALSDGWFRVSVSGVPSPRFSNLEVDVGVLLPDGTANFVGDGTSGLYVWGAQLETGTTMTGY